MVEMESQDNRLTLPSFKLVYKAMFIAGLAVVCFTAILNYGFIQNLAEPRISQVKELANTTSTVVSELALASFQGQNQNQLIDALNQSVKGLSSEAGGFLQISVILYPSGIYYASTNHEFINKKVGQSLLKKLDENTGAETTVEKLNYEYEKSTIPVLHILKNVTVEQNGEESRIAVTQILFDYNMILGKTRETLILASAAFLICIFISIWILYLPISRFHKQLTSGFSEITNKNFDFKLKTRDQGELGLLVDAFNKMTNHLKNYFQERHQSKVKSVISGIDGAAHISRELALRKADITCLCARIPGIQEMVEEKTPEDVAHSISAFIEPFETVVKEYGGQVIKVLGDKVYVLFEGINSIDNSIRTALKANQKWQVQNHERKVLNRKKLDFGIGMHSAEGIAGTIGHHAVSYTVVGKSASIAEYLCNSAKPEEILVSSSLMDKASGSFPHQVLGELEPVKLDETEQILVVTNLQYSNDTVLDLRSRSPQGTISDPRNAHSSNSLGQIAGNFGGLAGTSGHESSIPDMLEETLSNAPLDPVAPATPDNKKVPLKEKGQEKKPVGGKKQSLWDEFE